MFWREKFDNIKTSSWLIFASLLICVSAVSYFSTNWLTKNDQNYAYTWLIFLVFAILLAAPIIILIALKKFDPLAPLVLWTAMYGFLYLARPMALMSKNETFTLGNEFLNRALLIAMLGLICFYFGYYWNIGTRIAKHIPVIKKEISTRKLIIISFVFIVIGFLGLNDYIQTSGGWLKFWSKPHGYGGLAINTTAYIYQLPELMVVGFFLIFSAFIYRKFYHGIKFFTVKNIIVLTVASIGGVGIYTILWASRTMYSWVLIFAVTVYFLIKQTRPRLKTLILMILILYFVVALVPTTRSFLYIGNKMTISKFVEQHLKDVLLKPFAGGASDEFNVYLAETALVPDVVPYDYFNLYLRLFVHPIPRLIWPTKPVFLNSQWNDFISKMNIDGGAAETMLGDFYAQWGIAAVIIGTILSGIFWRTVYEYMNQHKGNFSAIVIYSVMLPNIITYIAQMPTIAILKWLPYILPSTIIALIASRKR